jgi:acetyltransferase-like isoleucine patch superfamily enzyme
MRREYRDLKFQGAWSPIFEEFFAQFEAQLEDPSVDNNDLVSETLFRFETGAGGYVQALSKAREKNDLASLTRLLCLDPRNAAQEPEYYGDIDREKYAKNKPLHWLWTYFDKLPLGRNTLFAFPFRRIMGRFMFEHLGENVKMFHNIEFTYGYNLRVDDNVVIHREVMLDDRGGIWLKRNSSVSDFANIYSHHHHADDIMDIEMHNTVIGEGARVTYHATVLSGQSLGAHAILGAMGLATRPIDDHIIKGGIPAKQLGKVNQ